jgi:hypothetical protein
MTSIRLIATLAFTFAVAPMASFAGAGSPGVQTASAVTKIGTASGSGTLVQRIFSKEPGVSPEKRVVTFEPKYSYVYPAIVDGENTLWIVVADQSLDAAALDSADNRKDSLRGWCEKQHAGFVGMQLDSHDKPMNLIKCIADGQMSTARLGEEPTGADAGMIELTLNDGKHVEGNMVSGVGLSVDGEVKSIDEVNGTYHFSADLASLTMRDLILSGGDSNAPGLLEAKATFLKYWKAAGSAKSLEALNTWFTPERNADVAAQLVAFAEFGGNPDRLVAMFTKGHAGTPTLTGAKAIGTAAVISSETSSDGRSQVCQTLMLHLQDAWKLGKEVCELK